MGPDDWVRYEDIAPVPTYVGEGNDFEDRLVGYLGACEFADV